MRESDKPQFLAVINGLAAVKPGAKITPEALDVWWAAFADWAIEDFRAAGAQLAKTCEFMPNPFHFEQLRKAGRPTTAEAFARARGIARNLQVSGGFLQESSSGDPVLDAAVRGIGGYSAIAMCDTEKLGFLERRFAEHYEQNTDASEARAALPDLTGRNVPALVSGLVNAKRLS